MDILYEWELERYGKLDTQVHKGWSILLDKGHTLKILSSRKLVLSSKVEILVRIYYAILLFF